MTSDQPTTKSGLMWRQLEGGKRWEALLTRVPPGRIAEPGVKGKLSVKDVVAHLADLGTPYDRAPQGARARRGA
jgi:hypothetical protein